MLRLDDFLDIASRVTGAPSSEISTQTVLWGAKRAFDAAAGAPGTNTEARHKTCATVLVRELLREPPLPQFAGRIAYECVARVLALNEGRWDASAPLTILRFDQHARSGDLGSELGRFISKHAIVDRRRPRRREDPDQEQLFGVRRTVSVGLFLANPLAALAPDERPELRELNRSIQSAARLARRRLGGTLEFQLQHPSTSVPSRRPSSMRPSDLWSYVRRLLLDEIDGMIVSDIAARAAGFGAASELDVFSSLGGRVLYLRRRSCTTASRYIQGRRGELGMDIAEYDQASQLPRIVSRWLTSKASDFEHHQRRRSDLMHLYRSVHRRLRSAWSRASREERTAAAVAAAMTIGSVNRVLTSVLATATLEEHRLEALLRSLDIDTEERRIAAGEPAKKHAGIDFGALLQAAETRGWPMSTVLNLRNRALADMEHAGLALRFRLTSPQDWMSFHDRLGH
jgi:hypothetical protein